MALGGWTASSASRTRLDARRVETPALDTPARKHLIVSCATDSLPHSPHSCWPSRPDPAPPRPPCSCGGTWRGTASPPISAPLGRSSRSPTATRSRSRRADGPFTTAHSTGRSEEHTSELQSRLHLVCRLLL